MWEYNSGELGSDFVSNIVYDVPDAFKLLSSILDEIRQRQLGIVQ